MRHKILIAFLLMSGLSLANEEHAAEVKEPVEAVKESEDTIHITESPDEIQIPSRIFDLINPQNLKINLVFVPVTLILKEKNPGILKKPELRIEYPRGGGTLDLSQWLTGRQGSFYVRFEFDEGSGHDGKKTFFVSRVRKRRVENEILGSGCRKFMEIQSALNRSAKSEGLLVNTTHQRHLAVLGGSFVFTSLQGKELRLSQVSFIDRTQSQYFCSPAEKSEKSSAE